MKIKRGMIPVGVFALTALLSPVGCALFDRHPETSVPRTSLPAQPAVHGPDFAQAPGAERPRVVETAPAPPIAPASPALKAPVLSAPAISIDPKAQIQQRITAEQDPRVLKELGERYVKVHTQNIRRGKVSCPSIPPEPDVILSVAGRQPITKLVYYSYTNNVTIVVCVRDNEIVTVGHRAGYQPAEGGETDEGSVEFLQAVQLASEDKRLANQIVGLKAHVLLMEPARGLIVNEAGHGHRVFWVTFSQPNSGDPQFWAIVDLNDKKVLDAGKESPK